MIWRKRKAAPLPPRPDDIAEARASRLEDVEHLKKLNSQANYVMRLSDKLSESRKHDLFGDGLQETFTRRGH